MPETVRCVMCQGRGWRDTGFSIVECADCKGNGRVDHCIACAGRGKLWLGGSEYMDCPVCPSARGGIVKPKLYVVMGETRFKATPIGASNG